VLLQSIILITSDYSYSDYSDYSGYSCSDYSADFYSDCFCSDYSGYSADFRTQKSPRFPNLVSVNAGRIY